MLSTGGISTSAVDLTVEVRKFSAKVRKFSASTRACCYVFRHACYSLAPPTPRRAPLLLAPSRTSSSTGDVYCNHKHSLNTSPENRL